jgi:4-amino-4-deoxy-L-arabinose transferase-like glycosyltransferase
MSDRVRHIALALLVLLLPLTIYILRLDDVAGMMVDDAWYVMLAKSLADGTGYWLVNAPLPDILPGYPPGFPALLSVAFRLNPQFPDNLSLLKGVSIVAMSVAGWLSYTYFHRDRQVPRDLAACTAVAIVLTPSLVFLATSTVMSECVFLVAQFATVVVTGRAIAASTDRAWRLVVVAGLLAAAAVLIRSVGVAVIAAACLAFVKEGQWKRAALFSVVALACLAPWLAYSRVHAPTHEQQSIHRGSIVYGYGHQFWMRRAGAALSGEISVAELPERIATNLFDVSGRGVGGIFVPALLRGADESGEEVLSLGGNIGWTFIGLGGLPVNIAISLAMTVLVAFGYVRTVREKVTPAELLVPISLGITVLWPWWTFRFVLPLTPFLFFYLLQGLRALPGSSLARVMLLTIIGLHLYDHVSYVRASGGGGHQVDWFARFAEVDRTLDWMDTHLEPDAVVATTNPALVHLRTTRRTIALDTMTEGWDVWRGRGATAVACLIPHGLPSRSRGPYRLLYESSSDLSRRAWVISIE